jgi:thiamine transport system substrate-binding protein
MVPRHLRIALGLVATLVVASGCSSDSQPEEIVLLTHASFALDDGTLDAFTEQSGVKVRIQISGDAGTMVNQAILTKDNPIADVLYGIDNTFLSRAIHAELFIPYTAKEINSVSTLLRIDGDTVTPIDFGDVCINFDIAGLGEIGVPPPANLEDLLDPLYEGLLVVEDPATSSPGLAFLMATIATYPDGSDYDWKAYWTDLFANGTVVATDWSEAYYTRFTRSGGAQPLVVSYASSPPAEVFFGDLAEAPTGVMTIGCFRQIEYAGILRGTDHEAAAGELIDFLLSVPVQEQIPLNMFVYPANSQATLPQVFADHTTLPEDSIVMEPDTIEENRERWIREWTEIARS